MKEILALENIDTEKKAGEFKSFSELADYFANQFPGIIEETSDNELKLLAESKRRDNVVREFSLKDALKAYNVSVRNITEIGNGRWSVSYKEKLREDLPDGYGFKGGAARHYLRESLGLPTFSPRDYDVVRLSEHEPYDGADNEIARRFMPKDFEFGNGVEYISDLDTYFNTRDLTINEVLATNSGIIATEQALLDTARNILRLTQFERNIYNSNGEAGPKMLAKLLRFYAEALQVHGDVPSILDIGHERIDMVSISPFWIAVNLDRAFERGENYARAYVSVLSINNQLPKNVSTPEEAVRYLLNCMSDKSFVFRSAPKKVFEIEDKWIEQLQEKEDLAISKIRRKIIRR